METRKCGACEDLLSEGVNCTACSQVLHFHCAGITEAGFRKLGDRKLTWRCLKCKQSCGTHLPSLSKVDPESQIMKEIRAISKKLAPLESLMDEVKSLRTEMTNLKTLMSESNKTLQDFNIIIEDLDRRVSKTETAQTQISVLQSQLERLEEESHAKDQWARINNIEIKGVNQTQNENLIEILSNIGKKIQYPIEKTNINFITRVPIREKGKNKPIIVCFNNRYIKEDFIAAARIAAKSNILTSNYFGLSGNHRVFINDHLTMRNKLLLSKTKKIGTEREYQYIWIKHTKIHVRKNNTSPILIIKSENDLQKII